MILRRSVLLLILLAGFTESLWAASGVQQLEAFLSGLTTLQADFRQILQQPDNDQGYISNGVFYMKRPGLLRWEYKTPNQQVIVADGNRIWLHDIELKQASFRSQKTVLKGTPAQLLSNTDPVDKHFQVNELPDQDDLSWIELVPKEKEAQFSSVRLAFNGNSLERMDMYDTFGQVTRFFFYNMQRNPNLSNSLFEFEPPPLIDLIGDL